MTKPFSRQQVFSLMADEQKKVEEVIVDLNRQLEGGSGGPLRDCSRLLNLGEVSALVLNEVASRFQAAGYLVEIANRSGPAMIRIK